MAKTIPKLLEITILSQEETIFWGKASRVIMPGESGVFEILPFHKKFMSRLLPGTIIVDEEQFSIHRGVVQVNDNQIMVIVEKERKE